MQNNNPKRLRKFDWFYFLALGLLIVTLTAIIISNSNEHKKLIRLEENTLLYLDRELCERVKYLESISIEFKESLKKPKDCNAYNKLEVERLFHND